jgi:LysM repeat protein
VSPTPELDETTLAQQYGFALTVLNSDPELNTLFHEAVAAGYTADAFTAKLRSTSWYKTHSENWRNAAILKASDPASYATGISGMSSKLGMMASEMGANVGGSFNNLVESAYNYGWDDNQIRQNLASYVKYTDGRMLGQAGQWEQEWRKLAADDGLNLSAAWYERYAKDVAVGHQTSQDVKSAITTMAVSAFPHLGARLTAGDTLATIADPYKQTMASLLEINPNTITMNDPTIRGALASKDAKGQPALRTLFDFENDVRKDTRWNKTKNAQDAAMTNTKRVLSDMGVLA